MREDGGNGMCDKEWSQLWLAYQIKREQGNSVYLRRFSLEGFSGENPIVKNSLEELRRGVRSMLELDVMQEEHVRQGLVLKRVGASEIGEEGYHIREQEGILTISAREERGLLYGVFHVLRLVAMEQNLAGIDIRMNPDNPLRMYNHWDNMDGDIERGYSGDSFFFQDNQVVVGERTGDYARLMASIGINGVVINNVNVKQEATYLITDRHFEKLAQMAELFAGYGIRFFLSLNFAAPIELGGPDSADPLEPAVIAWWKDKMKEVFARIPNLGGFLVKADSEGRPGPFTYGRTQADGANMLADIVKPYGGMIIWRCFVYNCTQDWRDYKTDRARAGYDNFIDLDGSYHDNVILQIKNGPMDFQIREPVSPLLGGLKRTNQMLEVQVAQEYTGHQIDLCYLVPMFKEILDFKTYCGAKEDSVADVVSGRTMGNRNAGMAAVSNTGNDANWTGNDLAAANLYGFGRLAFQSSLDAGEILEEWIRMSFSTDSEVVETIKRILLPSRAVYEKYTSPLGIGWMVTPNTHYGCSVDGYEYSRWGTYHRADHLGIGVDRSERGTGFVKQYYEPNASLYNQVETCPEELLLFFHHVPYTYRLKSGKTLIQHIYDSHFEGVEDVEVMMRDWESLQGKIVREAYERVRERLQRQLDNAREWRDQVNSYFYRKSGIEDEKGRTIY
ncbi:MAG: alpha-glucuronidase [Roseburia sp.]|nr:alpha-glucuronidase [Roseburia sp.]